MMKKFSYLVAIGFALFFASSAARAGVFLVTEAPTSIRFEQYTGAGAPMAFWRLPTPGVSTFPSSTCTHLSISTAVEVHASRFMALYLFAKTNNKNIFYQFDSASCAIISFGMDG